MAPAPVATNTNDDAAARERARADSIAAAESARRAAEERERAAAVARAREELTGRLFFDYDSDALTEQAQEKLRTKSAILRANPGLQIQVEGHADERGSEEYNLALGQRRAESVRDFLSGYGISSDRITTISYGEERPLVQGSTEEAWAQNRRAEFDITGGQITAVPAEVR